MDCEKTYAGIKAERVRNTAAFGWKDRGISGKETGNRKRAKCRKNNFRKESNKITSGV